MPAATLGRISMKALARYQVILLGQQRHIRCEQLAQGCCPNSAAVGVEPVDTHNCEQGPPRAENEQGADKAAGGQPPRPPWSIHLNNTFKYTHKKICIIKIIKAVYIISKVALRYKSESKKNIATL